MKKHRKARGWTQEQLAIVANVTVRTIQRLESGDSPAPETLMAVAQAFGMRAEQLSATSNSVPDSATRPYVHLLPRLATGGDLTAVLSKAHQFQLEHDDHGDPWAINAMQNVLESVGEAVVRLRDAKLEDRPVVEAELSKQFANLDKLGYYLFGIVRVVPKFFDEHLMLVSLATLYISHACSPKVVKANNMLVLPAILPEEATFTGSPVLGSEAGKQLSHADQARFVPPIY